MAFRKCRMYYFKIFLLLVLCISFYNIFHLLHLENLKFESLFIPSVNEPIPSEGYKSNLRAPNLKISSQLIHFHPTKTIDNSLFFRQGNFVMPENENLIQGSIKFAIFPHLTNDSNDDRIWNQMRYLPEHIANNQNSVKEKLILLFNGLAGTRKDEFSQCPVHRCRLTDNRELATSADIILWMHNIVQPFHKRTPGQIWAFYFLESPLHTPQFSNFENNHNSLINWTATYRHDSTIVAPYFKYTPYDLANPPPEKYPLPKINYSAGKTKMAAWFVSNCASSNNRIGIAQQLQKYISVDIYGSCGKLSCPRYQTNTCFSLLNKHYKFYLAFENSNCRDYITEKFFLNGLRNNILPIVMGAHPNDYRRISPPHSFIHVEDFDSIKELADYLKYLDKNDTAYNEYFSWKTYGLVDTNTFFWCRLCMMAHEGDKVKNVLKNVYKWWNGDERKVCINAGKWKDLSGDQISLDRIP